MKRILNLFGILSRKSLFLLGPRQTGKSTYLRQKYPEAKTYSLLLNDVYLSLSRDPAILRREITEKDKIVIIDEIQKLPHLLNEVHDLIEKTGTHFILTGSSARKLRKTGVNLLGGRASFVNFHPLSYSELAPSFDLMQALRFGLLPPIWLSDQPQADLRDYAGMYLREEVAAEGATRDLPAFSRFLESAALCNGQMINYTQIANDARISKTTCYEYFQILKDTLIAAEVPCWQKTRKRKALSTGKFYLFDIGVVRSIQGRGELEEKSADFGQVFEAFIYQELKTYCDYTQQGEVYYWKSKSGFAVDFIIGDSCAIEVKASKRVSLQDLKGLKALKEEKLLKKYFLVCRQETPQIWDGIEVLPWRVFLDQLWAGQWVT